MSKIEALFTFCAYYTSLNQPTRLSTLELSVVHSVKPVGYARGSLHHQDMLFIVWDIPGRGTKSR
jgi:hypothetical protein